MNYGIGGMTEYSGELFVIKRLNNLYSNRKTTILDIGANNGQYTHALIQHLDNDYTIHSFEPSSSSFQQLEKFQNDKNIFAHQVALSDKSGSAELYFDYSGTACASMNKINYSHLNVDLNKSEVIKTVTLDEFCISNSINHVHFCKIDVEGFEISVLKGAINLLTNNAIDLIQFEFGIASSFSGIYLKDFFEILSNYKIYRILQDGIYPLEYNERYEIFLTSNYLAINKNCRFKF
ncbi:MAG: FkbM family methyltransferase [Cytophagales bacterium]|nr:FkbM family methyltransferase [Cytophagales bacterium]